MNPFLSMLRNNGVQVIFAPSTVSSFYADTINYKRVHQLKPLFQDKLDWLNALKDEPRLPIGSGCEDKEQNFKEPIWMKQSKLIKIEKNDLISENATDIINILMNKKIKLVLYAGVHSNICVISRSFGMRNLKKEVFKWF